MKSTITVYLNIIHIVTLKILVTLFLKVYLFFALIELKYLMTKSYNQNCPLACSLDIIGEKWSPLILRELLLQSPKRYQDLLNSLPSLSASTLSDRLKKLEKHGIVERDFYSDHPPRAQYILTQKGKELRPALIALRDWGIKYADYKSPSQK